jgi:hypothetical protein
MTENPTKEYPRAVDWHFLQYIRAQCEGITHAREPNQRISRNGDEYLHRWMLGRKMFVPDYDNGKPDGMSSSWLPSEVENIYLHKFIRSDRDDPHSHPWANVTLVLDGWYYEDVFIESDLNRVGTFYRTAGDVVVRTPGAIHAITETSSNCLTLFLTGPKIQEWGFFKEGQFIHFQDYHQNAVEMTS